MDFFAAFFRSASMRVTRWIDGGCGAIQGPRARWENEPGILSGESFFLGFFRLEEVAFGHSLRERQDCRDSIRASQKGSDCMTKKSSKPTSSQALKLSLLAGAGEAGVMGQYAAADIVLAPLPH
jgi:hypothetical protein